MTMKYRQKCMEFCEMLRNSAEFRVLHQKNPYSAGSRKNHFRGHPPHHHLARFHPHYRSFRGVRTSLHFVYTFSECDLSN
jgi:hypothetical protein